MINIKLPKTVKGDELAEAVESTMNELKRFEVTNEEGAKFNFREYNPDLNKDIENRFLKARKAYLNPNLFFKGNFLIDTHSLTNYNNGVCVIKTKIGLDVDYNCLNIIVNGSGYEDINKDDTQYKYVQNYVDKFISNLNQKLKN